MSLTKNIKKLSRKVVTLQSIQDEAGNPLSVTIRKLKNREVMLAAGAPLGILALAQSEGEETEEERKARIVERIKEDPERVKESLAFQERLTIAVVCAGVASDKIVNKPFAELAEDEVHISELGDDVLYLFNEIISFSGLPYHPLEVAEARRF